MIGYRNWSTRAGCPKIFYIGLMLCLICQVAMPANGHPLMIDYDRLEQTKGKFFASGQRFMDQGDFKSAEGYFSKAIEEKRQGNDPFDLYCKRAAARLSLKSFAGALSDMDLAIGAADKAAPRPDNIRMSCAHQLRAEALAGAGKRAEAQGAFEKAISLWSTNGLAHMNLGLFYAGGRKKELAVKELHRAKEIMKNSRYNAPDVEQIDKKLSELEGKTKSP